MEQEHPNQYIARQAAYQATHENLFMFNNACERYHDNFTYARRQRRIDRGEDFPAGFENRGDSKRIRLSRRSRLAKHFGYSLRSKMIGLYVRELKRKP